MYDFPEIITNFIGTVDDPRLVFVIVAIFGLFILKVFIDLLRSLFRFR